MEIGKLVKQIIEKNEWLNGMADFREGDLMAIVNEPDRYREITETKDLRELFELLQTYDGVFKFQNILFFNSSRYGCFVYDINKSPDSYVEHFTIEIMSFESFEKAVNGLIS